MGREANCACEWNGATSQVKALLEPPELILRGALRRRIPFAGMQRLTVDGPKLCFNFGGEKFRLALGATIAAKWAQTMLAAPPTLAKKLGIGPSSTVWVIGVIDDDTLREALSDARTVASGKAGLILARVNTLAELAGALKKAADLLKSGVPLWIAYRKGRGHAINESDVRSAGLAAGIVDVKVAAVSPQLTALKFVRRKNPQSIER